MKKKIIFTLIIFLFSSFFLFLFNDGSRYIGINYNIESYKVSNFQKIRDFYKRHLNYKKLAKEINKNANNKNEKVINISLWVYKNIKKISQNQNQDIIDLHPWTIVERRLGTQDQFSDILSVLLIYSNIDSFFNNKFENIIHPITFFKYKNYWSIIDPYYGIYFVNNEKKICSLKEIKSNNRTMYHLTLGEVTLENYNKIFFNKKFSSLKELNLYYNNLLNYFPNKKNIDDINLYERGTGSRSYIQKPIHRIIFQLRKSLNSLFY